MLAQQACFLSLIQLEKERNPHGTNDNHRYEDLREEIAKSGQQRIKKAEVELQIQEEILRVQKELEYAVSEYYHMTDRRDLKRFIAKHGWETAG